MKIAAAASALSILFSSICFGQGATHVFIWSDELTADWYALTYECTDSGTVVRDGTVIEVWLDRDLSSANPELPTHTPSSDVQPTIGSGFGEVNRNSFVFNSSDFGYAPGSFANIGNTIIYSDGLPDDSICYLVVRCPDGAALYESSPFRMELGYREYHPADQTEPPHRPAWTCLYAECDPDYCAPTTSPFVIPKTPGGHEEDEPDEHYCLDLCVDEQPNLTICIGPLAWFEYPSGFLEGGCDAGVQGCDENCTGANFFDGWPWEYDPDAGLWCKDYQVHADGCACFSLFDILVWPPVELISFDAHSWDGPVHVVWHTASEESMDRFEILRDGVIVASIDAMNSPQGGSYEWIDTHVVNGVTYEYTLVAVAIDGTRFELASIMTTAEGGPDLITEYALHQNFPNPADSVTFIVFDVVEQSHVRLDVFDWRGEPLVTLVDGTFGNGRHTAEFVTSGLPNGFYEYRVTVGSVYAATKTILKNTTDPSVLLACEAAASTSPSGEYAISGIPTGRSIVLTDYAGRSLGEATVDEISLVAVKEGYQPADTALTITQGGHHIIDFTLDRP